MKLLIITQIIDKEHPILGFFHRWVGEFAKHCDHVHVICLQVGEYTLPANVTVHSLGKESNKGRLIYLLRFYKIIWQLRHEYDSVFVHMNQIYVILGGLFWRSLGKKIGLWYVHRQVTISLRVATIICNVIFSSSTESFNIKTKKVFYLGHGIDIDKYKHKNNFKENPVFLVAHVGRITRIKNIDILIESAAKLGPDYKFVFFGSPVTKKDFVYKEGLLNFIDNNGVKNVEFKGSVSNEVISNLLHGFDLTVNLTPTGGMDKAVIESAASGVPILTSNEAFSNFFGDYKTKLMVNYRDPEDLSIKIRNLKKLDATESADMSRYLIARAGQFDIKDLVEKISNSLIR